MEIVDILGLLVPNVWTTITQLCATALLFFLMYKLAYKPLKKILDTRSDFEQGKLEEAESLRIENEKLNEEAKKTIKEANITAEVIVDEAKKEGLEIKNNLIEQGKAESKVLIENAQKEVELKHDKMLKDMHDEIIDVALSATEKMLQDKIDAEKDAKDIDSFIKEITKK